ncbi:MAG: hypothetical protein K2X27_02955 [Candidatus Obscuribacterales bacterium]|nr:hypothetical protein [Candidatus Obscuribacterales bacterium]
MNALFLIAFLIGAYQFLLWSIAIASEVTEGSKWFGNMIVPMGTGLTALGILGFFFVRFFVNPEVVSPGSILIAGGVGIFCKCWRSCLAAKGVESIFDRP